MNIFENTICYRVELSLPGAYRQVKNDKIGDEDNSVVRTDANKDEITISKDILGSDEFEHIVAIDAAIRNFARSRALNAKGLKILSKGVYLLPTGLLDKTDTEVRRLIGERHQVIEQFITAYPAIIQSKKAQLKSLFDENEFPDVAKLRTSFRENVFVFDFGVPGKLEKLNQELFHRESEKMKAMWKDATADIRAGLRAGFLELTQRAAETLGTNEKGRKKRFHESTVTQIMEFMELFDQKNITNDNELQNIVQKAKAILQGKTPAAICELAGDTNYRANLQNEFSNIVKNLEKMVETNTRMVEL